QYWNFGGSLALGDCTAQASTFPAAGSTSVYSDGPDGEVVEKGGAAQRLRGAYSTCSGNPQTCTGLVSKSTNYNVCPSGQTPSTAACRLLKTCDGSSATSCTTLTSFDTSNTDITATTLNLADATQKDNLINWIRGKDIDNENANFDASTPPNPIYNEMRPSVHGGVVHSQPAVIDYGGTTGTIAFYGSDDGVFHAVDGGQTDTDGIELWGFIAPETMRKLNRLRTNSPPVAFPGVSGSPVPTAKDYFFDGSIGVYQNNGTVWLYPSMRRGGRAIYAFDVSTPASPVLKWRKGCFTSDTTDNTVCSPDTVSPSRWTGIGQTWSHPKIVYLDGYTSGGLPKPVLMFGGGYDQCEDTNSQTRCATTPRKGANIWFVDADTGDIIRTYPTHYSVPGDLAVLKNASGYLTYVYASDTGGNIYRINIGTTNADGTVFTSWSSNSAVSQIIIASLSEENHARKFMNGPSIVPTAGFNAVLIGSGDREHPLVSDYACGNYSTTAGNYVTNQFYMLMDKPAVTHDAWKHIDLVNVTSGTTTVATASGITTITNVLAGTTTSSTKGWWFNFGKCEQSVNEPLTVAGVTYFGTNAPSATTANSCTANLGYARGYAVDFLTANPIPASKTLAQQLASTATVGDATGPGAGVGASGEVINGVIVGAEGGSRNSEYVGGGMPPSPVAGVVDVEGTKYPFCIGCIDTGAANSSALQGSEIIIEPTGGRLRAFWYMESD
ncbi:MAG: PilC/PilY family type IV pilus protein, partial [Gallionella sp.]|nr:PilC/PilY family type IV pilus protein [Gallionella sp.]